MGCWPQQAPTWLSKGFPLINPPQRPSAQRGIYCHLGSIPQRGLQDLGCATQRWTFTVGIPGTGLVPWGLAASQTLSIANTLSRRGWSPHLSAIVMLLRATDIKTGRKINTGFAKAPEFALLKHNITLLRIALKPDPFLMSWKSLFL